MRIVIITVFLIQLSTILTGSGSAADWPQWHGPNRDGISSETGVLKKWPDSGPAVLWRTPLGEGFSSIVVARGAAYTMFAEGEDEYAVCLDAATGQERWRVKTGSNFSDWQGGNGPRSSPIIDAGRAFFLGAYGQLYALDVDSGETVWSHDFQTEYISDPPHWGFSTSPLLEGDLLIVEVGGSSGKAFIAFDKTTGEAVWTSQDDAPSYASPIAITVFDTRQIVFFPATGLVGVAAKDGQPLWRHPWQTGPDVNAATPVFLAPDRLFISSGYGKGAAVIQLISQNDQISIKKVWRNRSMKNHFATSIHHNGYLYGFDNAILKCIAADTGQEQWRKRGFQKGSLIFADGHLIVLSEQGKLALVEAIPEAYIEKASAQVLSPRCWTAPTLANGRLYLRNHTEMVCLDLRSRKK